MDRQQISGKAFAEKVVSAWNQTHGSEWNKSAAGFVKASLWSKKEGEIRVYLGDAGYLKMAMTPSQEWAVSNTLKYGLVELLMPIVKAVAAEYKPFGAGRVLMQEDEDGIIAPLGQHEPGVAIVREWYAD